MRSVVECSCFSEEGRDCIFMILNYKYQAIWVIRVGTTDDASGKCCLVAVWEEAESCPWNEANHRKWSALLSEINSVQSLLFLSYLIFLLWILMNWLVTCCNLLDFVQTVLWTLTFQYSILRCIYVEQLWLSHKGVLVLLLFAFPAICQTDVKDSYV